MTYLSLSLPHSPKTYSRALAQLTRLLEEQEDLKYWGEIECLTWELYNAFAYINMVEKGIPVPLDFQEENQRCIDERREEYALLTKEEKNGFGFLTHELSTGQSQDSGLPVGPC